MDSPLGNEVAEGQVVWMFQLESLSLLVREVHLEHQRVFQSVDEEKSELREVDFGRLEYFILLRKQLVDFDQQNLKGIRRREAIDHFESHFISDFRLHYLSQFRTTRNSSQRGKIQ